MVHKYFNVSLEAWQVNVDIEPVFNEYKTLLYVCQYLTETEDQYSHSRTQAVNETSKNKMHYCDTMKTIVQL